MIVYGQVSPLVQFIVERKKFDRDESIEADQKYTQTARVNPNFGNKLNECNLRLLKYATIDHKSTAGERIHKSVTEESVQFDQSSELKIQNQKYLFSRTFQTECTASNVAQNAIMKLQFERRVLFFLGYNYTKMKILTLISLLRGEVKRLRSFRETRKEFRPLLRYE